MKTTGKKIRKQNIIQFVLLILILALFNVVGYFLFTRIDLTAEKRFTLSSNTKRIIRQLKDVVYIQVMLDGDLPPQYRKLRNETNIMLNEFRSYNKTKIQFEFNDITKGKDKKQIYEILQNLRAKGIQPIVDVESSQTGESQKIIIPWAIANYGEREMQIQLLSNYAGPQSSNKDIMINNSIQTLEFKLIDAIRKLTLITKPRVAVLQDYGTLKPVQLAEAEQALSEYYSVEKVSIHEQLKALSGYAALIVPKPDSTFSEKDKFIIDQFIMKGGKVLWLIDAVNAEMDSLQSNARVTAFAKKLNLEDMLFKYGARINTDILMDMNGIPIPILTGTIADQPQFEFYTWPYFPMIMSDNVHPIVKNINPVRTEFTSSIDTVGGKGIKKTVLLKTSRFSRKQNTPATISLDILKETPDKAIFNKSHIPVAVLLEGEFESVFHNRLPPEISESKELNYRDRSVPNKMIVVSDGDIIKNQYVRTNGKYMTYPLGYDRYTKTTYGNQDLLLNMMSYLCDEENLLDIRSRELKLRLLDKTRITKEKLKWQIINLVFPVLCIVVLGIVFYIIRKRKFTSQSKPIVS